MIIDPEQLDTNAMNKCFYCGCIHSDEQLCPMISAIDYYPDGTIKRIELREAKIVPAENIINFPEPT